MRIKGKNKIIYNRILFMCSMRRLSTHNEVTLFMNISLGIKKKINKRSLYAEKY